MDGRKVDFVVCDEQDQPDRGARAAITHLAQRREGRRDHRAGHRRSGILRAGPVAQRAAGAAPRPGSGTRRRSPNKANGVSLEDPSSHRARTTRLGMESLWKQIVAKGANEGPLSTTRRRVREVSGAEFAQKLSKDLRLHDRRVGGVPLTRRPT
jgi:hypothetical protein